MGALVRLIIVLTFVSCGQNIPVTKAPIVEDIFTGKETLLTGNFTTLAGDNIRLDDLGDKPNLIIFASDTCSICRKEAKDMVSLFNQNGGVPTNIHLYTIMLGGYVEDAEDWARSLNVTWDVGVDPGDKLFREYCPGGKTPCVLALNPSNQTLTRFTGESSLRAWEKETGTWTY